MKHLEESHKLEAEDEEDMAELDRQIKADEMEARNGSDGVSRFNPVHGGVKLVCDTVQQGLVWFGLCKRAKPSFNMV